MRNSIRRPLAVAAAAATVAAGSALLAPAAPAAAKSPSSEQSTSSSLRQKVTLDGILEHERAFQKIATDNPVNGTENRAAGFPGYDRSVDYVVSRLKAAGYAPVIDEFLFDFFAANAPAQLRGADDRLIATDYFTYSGNGTVAGTPVPVDVNLTGTRASTSGCQDSDFDGFTPGSIALVQRGTCTFGEKVANAEEAGAIGVIIFNQGNTPARSGLLTGTLGGADFKIPVVGTSFADGEALVLKPEQVRIVANTTSEERETVNVLADLVPTAKKRGSDVVVVGAHLDSVPAGPGINDNGSGSSTILEIAEQMAGQSGADKGNGGLTNTVRFAWWGAEELGLLGSEAYVAELAEEAPAELDRIKVNLNFDMVGSPNYGRFVYDGDNSAFKADGGVTSADGPPGSGEIERVFTDYFNAVGLASGETPFSGRSDYGPFIAEGIAAGGLFTGAEGTKTAKEVEFFGGKAGVAYDPCYHQACDRLDDKFRTAAQATALSGIPNLLGNLNLKGLDEMSDAAAHATYVFARRDLVKQPLVDPSKPVTGVATTASGGGNELHDDHDHEGETS